MVEPQIKNNTMKVSNPLNLVNKSNSKNFQNLNLIQTTLSKFIKRQLLISLEYVIFFVYKTKLANFW
jgi:hypothetical protein